MVNNSKLPLLRIGAISAYNEQSMIAQCHEAGIVDFLPKPFEYATIQSIFEQVFDQKFDQNILASEDDEL